MPPPTRDATRPSTIVLANRSAGDADAELIRRGVACLAEDAAVALRWTSSVDEVAAVITDAMRGTLFVAAGGDGTIHSLVHALHAQNRLDQPVGLIPVGTGNDLARNTGIPDDPVAAARAIRSGTRRRLPLVTHDGQTVVNCAHAGLGIAAAAHADALKTALGALSYPLGTLRAILSYTGMRITLTLDGRPLFRGPCTAVAVAVAGVGVGGGHPVMPAGDFPGSADEIAVVIARAPRLAGRLLMPVIVARDRRPPGMAIAHGSRLEWDHEGPLPVDNDGQLQEWAPRGALEVVGSWELLGAASAPA